MDIYGKIFIIVNLVLLATAEPGHPPKTENVEDGTTNNDVIRTQRSPRAPLSELDNMIATQRNFLEQQRTEFLEFQDQMDKRLMHIQKTHEKFFIELRNDLLREGQFAQNVVDTQTNDKIIQMQFLQNQSNDQVLNVLNELTALKAKVSQLQLTSEATKDDVDWIRRHLSEDEEKRDGKLRNLTTSCTEVPKTSGSCAVLYGENTYNGRNFSVGDGKYFLDLPEEYTSSNTVWNLTSSFKVNPGCLFTACSESYYDGHCEEFREGAPVLPPAFVSIDSVNCTCAADCRCSNIHMGKSSCARAYLHNSCNSCNAYYTDLKGKNSYFPDEFKKNISSLVIRPGCTLTVYDEEDDEGDSFIYEGIIETWKQDHTISSYECTCSDQIIPPIIKKPRCPDYPDWINVPRSLKDLGETTHNGDGKRHPALVAALKSMKHARSPKNAYILLLGTSGSGKSSTINLLLNNPNLTKVRQYSTTSAFYEFRVPVPVDELGLANSELRVIDTPGLGHTRGLEQDATLLATLDEYLTNHEELSDKIPNVVLVFHKFSDNRFRHENSTFVKMLRGLNSFLPRITDKEYSNVIFVLSHFTAETRATVRRPKAKLAAFKKVIEEYSLFPKPVTIVVAENKADSQELPLVNGYFRLPNGDYYPRNIYDKIQFLTSNGEDPIGESIMNSAFRDLNGFNISYSTTPIVAAGNPKVSKYLNMLVKNVQ